MIRELEQIIRKWVRENNELNIKVLAVHLYQYIEKEKEKAIRYFLEDVENKQIYGWLTINEYAKETYLKNNCLECKHDYKPTWLGVDTFKENIKTITYDRKLKQCSICGHIERR